MKRFTTPCFVRVEDAEAREEVLQWCIAIGYLCPVIPKEEMFGDVVICDGECVGIVHDPTAFSAITTYKDCGTDVGCFKALAAMNDENDLYQAFIDDDGNFAISNSAIAGIKSWEAVRFQTPRKATAEEIIEHFKNK